VRGTIHKAIAAAAAVLLALLLVGCPKPEREYKKTGEPPPARTVEETAAESQVSVEPRTSLLVMFPCTRCHAKLPRNPQKRTLVKFHVIRNTELHHGDPKAWCYNCHSLENIDRLVISSGELVTFDEAYRLCGGCHGDKLRDWKVQVHGKTMGHWRGEKIRRSCTGCHNPHRPAFPPLEPEPAPIPPEMTTSETMVGQMR
jgi:hypothetical protein